MVKVRATSEELHKILRHPIAGPMTPSQYPEPADWPEDQFTTRKLQDGDVVLVEEAKPHAEAVKAATHREGKRE